ncbi:MAG TPA: M48 family metalloprotease [Paracoccaceae bacterium]|nr:M48 family metalloprotease [Paracoccaceae bacterium]
MLKLTPILMAMAVAVGMYLLSAWRLGKQLDARSTELADPALERLTRKMAQVLDLPRIRVNIFEIDPVNGLAAPDGRIFITRGFFEKYRRGEVSAEELSSVIAHELGHVALGHSKRRMVDFSGQNAIRVILAMFLGRLIPGLGVYLANLLTGMLAARLSRQDEYEADAYAAALLTKAGIGTDPQISLFQKLERMTSGAGGGQLAWMLSHPKTDQRIAAIEKLRESWLPVERD